MKNKHKSYAFDATNRDIDPENGYLRVSDCILSRESVDPYYGWEVPGWSDLGLSADEVYYVYRPEDELEKSVQSFQGVPLLVGHHEDSAEDPRKDERVGAVMNDVRMEGSDLIGSISVMDSDAIDGIEEGFRVCLSSAYTYTPVMESGDWQGVQYGIRMTEIHGNHVALVEEGRVKGAMVADEKPQKRSIMGDIIDKLKKLLNEGDVSEDETDFEKREKVGQEEFGLNEQESEEYAREDEEQDRQLAKEIKAEDFLEGLTEIMEKARNDEGAMESLVRDVYEYIDFALGDKARDEKKAEDEEGDIDERRRDHLGKDRKDKAMDAATVLRSAEQRVTASLRAKSDAARAMRSIVGDVDIFAYNSADDIYKQALISEGVSVKGHPTSAYRGMAEVLVSKASASLTQDWAIGSTQDVKGMPDRIKNIKKGWV